MLKISEEQLKRVCRMYNTNREAYAALHISPNYFLKYCAEFGIETPKERRASVTRG